MRSFLASFDLFWHRPFESVSTWLAWPCFGLLVVVLFVGLVWLYPRDGQQKRTTFLILRGCLLFFLILLAGFRPILQRTRTEPVRPKFWIVIDTSSSMSIADPKKRVDRVRDLLLHKDSQFLKRLEATHDLEVCLFDQRSQIIPASTESIRQALAEKETDSQIRNTHLHVPIDALLQSIRADQPLTGMLLLSDGQDNGPIHPLSQIKPLVENQIAIYPILMANAEPLSDLAIQRIKAPSRLFPKSEAQIEVDLSVRKFPEGPIRVQISGSNLVTAREETIQHDGKTSSYTVRFPFTLEKPGLQTLLVRTEAIQPDDYPQNNSAEITIDVLAEKARVLLIDQEARWEYRYLLNALQRDTSVQVVPVLFDPPRMRSLTDEEEKQLRLPNRSLSQESDSFARYDCLILGDISPESISPLDRERLAKWVSDAGGTLILQAGKRSMPLEWQRQAEANPDDPLWKLLPMEQFRMIQAERGFSWRWAEEGQNMPFYQLESTMEETQRRWSQFPLHYWGIVGKAKPAAVPFASFEEPGQSAQQNCLVVLQKYGFGKVLFVGIDSTWRWREKIGDKYHHAFWSQLIRWAASERILPAGNERVRFGTREASYVVGQPVDLLARLDPTLWKQQPQLLLGTKLFRQSETNTEELIRTLPLLSPSADSPERSTSLTDLPVGSYRAEFHAPDLVDLPKIETTFRVLSNHQIELSNLSSNPELLEELANQTQGKVLVPEQSNELLELLNQQTKTRTISVEYPLAQSWFILLLMLGLLTWEWVLRKRMGFV